MNEEYWKPHLPKIGSLIFTYGFIEGKYQALGLCVSHIRGNGRHGANLMVEGKIVFYTSQQFALMAKDFRRYDYEKIII